MSDRFVSGGVIDPGGEAPDKGQEVTEGSKSNSKNSEWEAVQRELEAERKRREEQRIKAASGEEKSLYEILQANKEAKQAAFEEQNKIRNQFRALDDDEISFLDEVRERQRKEEEAKKRELEEGLKAFREARKAESTPATAGESGQVVEGGVEGGESWEVSGKKRKRAKGREREVKGVRRKVDEGDKTTTAAEEDVGETTTTTATPAVKPETAVAEPAKPDEQDTKTQAKAMPGASKALGLVDYGSDDSDDE